MITQGNRWARMHALAQRARLAGTRRQRLDVRLSPEESVLLADVYGRGIAVYVGCDRQA